MATPDAEGARAPRGREASDSPRRRCPTCGVEYPLDYLVCPKDATSLELATGDDPLIGEVLAGSFMITGTLGEGGMGRVYEAEHVRLPRRFAIKVMLEQLASHPDAVARFEREAQAVARIANPHVLDVVDVVRVQGRPCMVTELLQGEELADVLDRVGKLPLARGIAIARQVCRGLAAAHAVGVIHRDLKPSNLFLLDRDGGVPFVKILDFGIAKMADGSQLTRTGMVLGTPAYMAPEQARGATNVDTRVDIYALGAVLYHMVTGRPPFVDEEQALILSKVLTEDPPRPRDLDRSIPEGIEALILRAMARDPAERPADVQELDRLLATLDTTSVAEGPRAALAVPRAERAVPAAAETVAVQAPPIAAEDVTRRVRGPRLAALVRTVVFSLFEGAAVLVASATLLRVAGGVVTFAEKDLVVGVISLATALLLFLGGARVIVTRWRSATAIERLRTGLGAALQWLVVPLGALTLGARGYALFGPVLPREYAAAVDSGVVVVPVLLGLCAFSAAVWRARRS